MQATDTLTGVIINMNRWISVKRKEHKPKLLGPDVFRWGGALPCEGGGGGGKKFGMSPEIQGNQTFGRDIPGFLLGHRKV